MLLRSSKDGHPWGFFRAGGLDQVVLATGEDIASLAELDPKLWVVLGCPTRGLEFDPKTLDLIDSDCDGRIRVSEVVAAARWASACLKDPGALLEGREELPLAAIDGSTEEGAALLASAGQVLASLGKPDAAFLTAADTADTERIFAQTRFNGDGVIPPESVEDDALRAIVETIMAHRGSVVDRSGRPGLNRTMVEDFFTELEAYARWRAEAEAEAAAVLPLGEGTADAFAAFQAVRPKIDDYFARCRLVAFDPRAGAALNRTEAEYQALAACELSACGTEVAGFPLARVEGCRPLPLSGSLNPAWAAAMERFAASAVAPLVGHGRTELGPEEWKTIVERLAPHEAWLARKAGASVEGLGLDRVREILASGARQAIEELIGRDEALRPEMDAISAVDRLVRYHRDLYRLLVNFVSFADFYGRKRKAIFQAGTLYLDGRSCELCLRVDDPAKHAGLAALAKTYLAYCECRRKDSAEVLKIAAAFTGGDSDNLMVGRNGVFYDRQGRDWDATIIKILENPISIRQAVWAPYKRMGRMLNEQIEKLAAARDKALQDKAGARIADGLKGATEGKPLGDPGAAPGGVANMVGVLAAVGLAIGAIGTALATAASAFLGLRWWQMPLAVLGLLVLVSGPSAVLAWLKLRQRNLGPILDANGWAVNGRVKINIPFGAALTHVAALPPGASRSLVDPYAEGGGRKRLAWTVGIVVALAVGAGSVLYLGGWGRVLAVLSAK